MKHHWKNHIKCEFSSLYENLFIEKVSKKIFLIPNHNIQKKTNNFLFDKKKQEYWISKIFFFEIIYDTENSKRYMCVSIQYIVNKY